MRKEQAQLAEAMGKLAQAIDRFQDPVLWQRVFSEAMRSGVRLPIPAGPIAGLAEERLPAPAMGQVVGLTIALSSEDREKLASQVYQELLPELNKFNEFLKESLKDMPAGRLKEIAERLERGQKPRLGRQHGCVFIAFASPEGNEDPLGRYFLGL